MKRLLSAAAVAAAGTGIIGTGTGIDPFLTPLVDLSPATLSFTLTPGENGVTTLNDLHLTGSGLGARGQVTLDKEGLLAATLTDVAISPGDSVNVGMQRGKSGKRSGALTPAALYRTRVL